MKDYVAFDLETTGLSLERDQIIEIGAVKVRDGKISGKYNCIIHPEIEVSDFIINLTGIDRNMPVSYTHLFLMQIAAKVRSRRRLHLSD